MSARRTTNGTHGMSLLVGELIGKVEHLTGNVKMKDAAADVQRKELNDKMDRMNEAMTRLDVKVDGVQRDVAEIKAEQARVRATLDSYKSREDRALGWWDSIKAVKLVVWPIILFVFWVAYAGVKHFLLPWLP